MSKDDLARQWMEAYKLRLSDRPVILTNKGPMIGKVRGQLITPDKVIVMIEKHNER